MSMINLMPPEKKDEIKYSRLNTHLIRWAIAIAIAFAVIVILISGSLFYLSQDTKHNQSQADAINKQLETPEEKQVIETVNELSGNLKLTVDVLSNEVLFSKLLTEIGNVMPPRTVLSSLNLNSELAGGLDLEIRSASYESGVQAQLNLVDEENGLFEAADIGSVSCESQDPAEGPDPYPCTAFIRVLFPEDNQMFFKLYSPEEE